MRELHCLSTKIQRDPAKERDPGRRGKEETRVRPGESRARRKGLLSTDASLLFSHATAPGAWEGWPALLQESEIIVKVSLFLWKKRCGQGLASRSATLAGK